MRKLISRVLPLVLVLVLAVGCLSAMAAETPALPSATITEVQNDDLTFAMNFRADIVTDEQLAYYGNWYADFVLTFSEPVTLNANGGADGYLSGQYDKWSENWVNVPLKDVTLQAGESLKIMEYAAELKGEPGLKYTYKEVYESVKDFDCGVFLENDYILNHPDAVITLELRIFNNENESESYRIGDLYEFRFNFVARNTATGKLYEDVSDALRAAQDGQTVELLKDAADDIVSVYENTTLDLAGHTLTAAYVSSFGDTVDSSADNSGVLAAKHLMIQPDNEQVTAKTAKGYQFFEVLSFLSAYEADKERFCFVPEFEAAARELLAPGAATSGVTVQVDVSWQTADGHTRTQLFEFSDEFVNGFLASYNPSIDWYGKMFILTLKNTADFSDLTFEASVVSDTGVRVSENDFNEVESSGNVVTEDTTITHKNGSALVPAGTVLDEGATALVLSATEMDESQSNVTLSDGETMLSMDVCVEGVSKENTTPIIVTLNEVTAEGLNIGNITLYHVENGVTTEMTRVFSIDEVDEHNEYYYDIETGTITMALASFSEISFVTENTAPWEGKFDYTWYKADATELTIANADQLAAFSAIVGGMNGQTQDSFKGKTVKLICDINLNDASSEDGKVFYPIGYYNTTGAYTKQSGIEVSSYFQSFEGTFDGNGNTVANFYQNTWEMFGDYNEGYAALSNHYRDGMGLFGHVNGGTVKNLTVENFSSDGEHNTTGCIAAYADCGATFENISIFSCNPRVYNIGNGGIVGCVGWYARSTVDTPVTFRNITVDNTNKISALWGSWDVACGGIVGQYYPTSGQSSANYPANAGIYMENCHVSAQIDVYNDVCANYQYYAYRYAGMLVGSVRENETIDGRVYPKMDGITASGCTVHYGDWNDYYYCELVANSLASYTHDHQMSRLTQVAAVDVENKTYTPLGSETALPIPAGRVNYVVVKNKDADGMWIHGDGADFATCYHFVDGVQHLHTVADNDNPDPTETVNGDLVLKEDKQLIYREFDQLVTGYGWGVTSKGIGEMDGVTILDRKVADSVKKFTEAEGLSDLKFTPNAMFTIGQLFAANTENTVAIDADNVQVFVSPVGTDSTVTGEYFINTSDWTAGTLLLTGEGAATITITDYNFCVPLTINITVAKDEETETPTTSYGLIKTLDDLMDGGDLVVVARNRRTSAYYAMTTGAGGDNISATAVTIDGDTVILTDESAVLWTVEPVDSDGDGVADGLSFYNGSQYLTHAGKNNFGVSTDPFTWSAAAATTDWADTYSFNIKSPVPYDGVECWMTYAAGDPGSFSAYKSSNDSGTQLAYTCFLQFYRIGEACDHANKVNVPAKAPTCTEAGYTEGVYCNDCQRYLSGHEIKNATGHQWQAKTTIQEATCTEKGIVQQQCYYCNTVKLFYTEMSDHVYEETITKAATCTEPGIKTGTCNGCGETVTEEIPATGHQNTTTTTVEATCTATGSITVTCDDCGATVSTTEIPLADHSWNNGEITTAPTCAVEGEKTFTCTACDATKTESIPATGEHTYGEDGVCTTEGCGAEKPTSTLITSVNELVTGSYAIVAEYDGEYYALGTGISAKTAGVKVTVDMDKGVIVSETSAVWTITKNDNGTVTLYNGTSYLKYKSDTDLGSSSSAYNWVLTDRDDDTFLFTASTSNERALIYRNTYGYGGYSTKNVTASGYSGYLYIFAVDPCDHEKTTTTTVDATCSAAGSITVTCDACQAIISKEEIEKLPHTEVIDEAKDPTCTETGLTEGKHCSVCNEVIVAQETVAALGHSYDAVVTEPTETEQGYTTYTCSVCGDSYVDDYTPALGQSYTVSFSVPNGVTAIDNMTCDSNGITLPTAADITGYTFAGWVEAAIEEETATAPTILTGKYIAPSDITLYAVYTRTEGSSGTSNYVKVTEDLTDWTGEYLIVYEAGKVAFNGDLTALDKVGNYINVAISNNTIEASDNVNKATFTIEKNGSKYTIKSASGMYIGRTTTSNGFESSFSTKYNHTIEFSNGTVSIISSGGPKLQFFSQSGSEQFKYYKSNQQAIALYVKESGTATTYYTTNPVVPCDEHTPVGDGVVTAPTCTAAGYTTYTCSVCGKTYTDNEVAANGHTEVVDAAVEATCKDTGLTEGKHCSVCNEVIVEQTVVPVTSDHTDENSDNICDVCETEITTGGTTEPVTVSMNIFANKGTLTNKVITWTSGDVTFQNAQGSSTNAIYTTDSNLFRVYANSSVTISANGGKISEIKITCTSSKYADALKTSVENTKLANASVSGNVVTITLNEPAESFTFTASAQIRLNKIEVTYTK